MARRLPPVPPMEGASGRIPFGGEEEGEERDSLLCRALASAASIAAAASADSKGAPPLTPEEQQGPSEAQRRLRRLEHFGLRTNFSNRGGNRLAWPLPSVECSEIEERGGGWHPSSSSSPLIAEDSAAAAMASARALAEALSEAVGGKEGFPSNPTTQGGEAAEAQPQSIPSDSALSAAATLSSGGALSPRDKIFSRRRAACPAQQWRPKTGAALRGSQPSPNTSSSFPSLAERFMLRHEAHLRSASSLPPLPQRLFASQQEGTQPQTGPPSITTSGRDSSPSAASSPLSTSTERDRDRGGAALAAGSGARERAKNFGFAASAVSRNPSPARSGGLVGGVPLCCFCRKRQWSARAASRVLRAAALLLPSEILELTLKSLEAPADEALERADRDEKAAAAAAAIAFGADPAAWVRQEEAAAAGWKGVSRSAREFLRGASFSEPGPSFAKTALAPAATSLCAELNATELRLRCLLVTLHAPRCARRHPRGGDGVGVRRLVPESVFACCEGAAACCVVCGGQRGGVAGDAHFAEAKKATPVGEQLAELPALAVGRGGCRKFLRGSRGGVLAAEREDEALLRLWDSPREPFNAPGLYVLRGRAGRLGVADGGAILAAWAVAVLPSGTLKRRAVSVQKSLSSPISPLASPPRDGFASENSEGQAATPTVAGGSLGDLLAEGGAGEGLLLQEEQDAGCSLGTERRRRLLADGPWTPSGSSGRLAELEKWFVANSVVPCAAPQVREVRTSESFKWQLPDSSMTHLQRRRTKSGGFVLKGAV